MKPNNIILECVVGSQMYNLDTPDSDIDIKGIYVLPTNQLLNTMDGFRKIDKVYDHNDPDWAYFEVQKYMGLVIKGNPTALELLFANEYTKLTPTGQLLIDNRDAFLSKKIKNAYIGYALQQVKRKYRNASDITEYRAGKHVRHTWRLIKQYEQLATTGTLQPRLTDTERAECFAFMEKSYEEVYDWFRENKERLEKLESVLPDEPDYDRINNILKELRTRFYENYFS